MVSASDYAAGVDGDFGHHHQGFAFFCGVIMFGIDDAILLPAAASFVGGIFRNKSQERQADKQMQFQDEMSSTAHQREVQDLMAAGLNPMLSAKLGGASSPGGAMAQIEDVVSPAVSSAQQGQSIKAQVDKMKAETDNTRMRTVMDGQLLHAQAELADAQRVQALASANAADASVMLTGENVKTAPYTRANLSASSAKSGQDLAESVERTKGYDIQRQLTAEQAIKTMADTAQTDVLTELRKLDINQAKSSSQFFGSAIGESAPLARFLIQILSAMKGAVK